MTKSGMIIRGNVEVAMRQRFRGMDDLEKLLKREWETGESILTPFQREMLEQNTVKKVTVNNLTMGRTIDRMVCLFGRCPGYAINTLDDDRGKIANFLHGYIDHNIPVPPPAPVSLSYESNLMFPELIGIGSGRTPPTIDDSSLEKDFNSYALAPENVTYRNTYNSKTGGILKNNATASGDEYESDYIAKYAQIYSSDEINFLPEPIWEVGLFAPKIQMGIYSVEGGTLIYFDGQGTISVTPNTVWSMLNLTLFNTPNMGTIWATPRDDIVVGRAAQIITLKGLVASNILVDNILIAAITPRWDSIGAAVGEWGHTNDFTTGPLLARAVLPVSFIKNNNFSLTVLWQIYFERF